MGLQFKNFLLIPISFFAAVFILPVFVLFVYFPLYLFRQTVISLSSYKSDLYLPLNICSCCTAWDDMYSKPRCSVCGLLYLKGRHDFKELIPRVEKLIAKHPELTCTLSRWMSNFFWKKCDNFQLSNHVTLYDESDPEKIRQFLFTLPEKPYKEGRPLWEIISIPNHSNAEYGTKSTIVVRIHHTLGDGFAYLALVRDLSDKIPKLDEKYSLMKFKNGTRLSTLEKVAKFLQLIFITPTETIYNILKGFDSNPLKLISPNQQSGQMVRLDDIADIDLSFLKRISKNTGSNITSIMYSCMSGALRKVMIEKGGDVTKDVTAVYILPEPNHPGTMTNNVFFIPMNAPISEKQGDRRLAKNSKQFKHIFNSTLTIGQRAVFEGTGMLFAVLGKEITVGHFGTYIHSNFAIFEEPYEMFGHVVERVMPVNGLQRSANSLLVVTASYNGKMGIGLTADKALFPDEDSLKRVIGFLKDELNALDK